LGLGTGRRSHVCVHRFDIRYVELFAERSVLALTRDLRLKASQVRKVVLHNHEKAIDVFVVMSVVNST
jgi:hypothetical protein